MRRFLEGCAQPRTLFASQIQASTHTHTHTPRTHCARSGVRELVPWRWPARPMCVWCVCVCVCVCLSVCVKIEIHGGTPNPIRIHDPYPYTLLSQFQFLPRVVGRESLEVLGIEWIYVHPRGVYLTPCQEVCKRVKRDLIRSQKRPTIIGIPPWASQLVALTENCAAPLPSASLCCECVCVCVYKDTHTHTHTIHTHI
jgi:hypothetical protein